MAKKEKQTWFTAQRLVLPLLFLIFLGTPLVLTYTSIVNSSSYSFLSFVSDFKVAFLVLVLYALGAYYLFERFSKTRATSWSFVAIFFLGFIFGELILYFLFTPFLGYLVFSLGLDNMCSGTNYFVLHGATQTAQFCSQVYHLLGR